MPMSPFHWHFLFPSTQRDGKFSVKMNTFWPSIRSIASCFGNSAEISASDNRVSPVNAAPSCFAGSSCVVNDSKVNFETVPSEKGGRIADRILLVADLP